MKKSKNIGGEPILLISIQMPVALKHFAKALADDHYERDTEFDPSMKKDEGIRILKRRLMHHGVSGLYTEHWEAASEEFMGEFNQAYTDALQWISKHFPYLKS